MIKWVKILPRMAVHSLANNDFYAPSVLNSFPANDGIRLVSLNGSGEEFLTEEQIQNLREKYGFTAVHSYQFDDIGGEIWESIVRRKNIDRSTFIEIDDSTAEHIRDNVLAPYDPIDHCEMADELLVVHCHAGISRSSAVGLSLAYHLGLKSSEVRDMNPNIDPNKFILAKMLKALGHSEVGFNMWRNSRSRF